MNNQIHYLEYHAKETGDIYSCHFYGEHSEQIVKDLIKNHKLPKYATYNGIKYDYVVDKTGKKEIKIS